MNVRIENILKEET